MLFNSESCERLHNRNVSVTTYAYEIDTCHLWRSDGPMVQSLKKNLVSRH